MMKATLELIKISLISLVLFAFVLCGVYPLVIYGIGQLCFSSQAKGSLIMGPDGKTCIGSKLIGQNFHTARYFHPRPSSAGPDGYNAVLSSGSNLGPTSQKLIDSAAFFTQKYRAENGLSPAVALPVDAVTTSSSGLDPHISIQNALLQVPRVAKSRNMSESQIQALVQACTEGRSLGFLGHPRVNVLLLNLKLDSL